MDNEEPNDAEEVVCLSEFFKDQNDMINEATAVLGVGNDNHCTYTEGYMKRQALYSCLTCIPEAKERSQKGAGICLACSYNCHEGHELVELYTRRNFRCDCGNTKFTNVKCNLTATKSDLNDENVYNQNFGGLYCICHRPYPDPDDPVPDEMVQCIICEDWYHSRHLGVKDALSTFAEMICGSCVEAHPFLAKYSSDIETDNEKEEKEEVDVEAKEETTTETDTDTVCTKPTKEGKIETLFFQSISWRQDLCTCKDCKQIYSEAKLEFLLDPQDPVQTYEERNLAKGVEMVEKEQQNVFKSMDRVQMNEFAAGFNDLRENLKDFLQKFSENKKMIRAEDVHEFFDEMKARKRQKTQYNCR